MEAVSACEVANFFFGTGEDATYGEEGEDDDDTRLDVPHALLNTWPLPTASIPPCPSGMVARLQLCDECPVVSAPTDVGIFYRDGDSVDGDDETDDDGMICIPP